MWRSVSTFQARSAARGGPRAGGAVDDVALTPFSGTTYGDLLVDMSPGEERRFDPLGEVGAVEGRFFCLTEGGSAPTREERRDWGSREHDMAVARSGGGGGWATLGSEAPVLHVTGAGGQLRSRFDPFPVVSAAFRDVAERLDAQGTAFHPVDLRLDGGVRAKGEWFLFDIVRIRQVVDLSRFRGAVAHARGALRLASRCYAFDERRDIPGDVHFVRDPLLANVELASIEAKAAFIAAGIADLAFAPIRQRGL